MEGYVELTHLGCYTNNAMLSYKNCLIPSFEVFHAIMVERSKGILSPKHF